MTGFITVSKTLQKKLPAYPIPILRVSRLAVDMRFQNQDIGKLLLRSLFELAINIRKQIGSVGIVVDAKESAVSFYTKLGFIPLVVTKGQLRTPSGTIALFLNLDLVIKAQK